MAQTLKHLLRGTGQTILVVANHVGNGCVFESSEYVDFSKETGRLPVALQSECVFNLSQYVHIDSIALFITNKKQGIYVLYRMREMDENLSKDR